MKGRHYIWPFCQPIIYRSSCNHWYVVKQIFDLLTGKLCVGRAHMVKEYLCSCGDGFTHECGHIASSMPYAITHHHPVRADCNNVFIESFIKFLHIIVICCDKLTLLYPGIARKKLLHPWIVGAHK